jgi:transposase
MMPKMLRYTPEFKDQCVRLVFAEIGPDESRKAACTRLAAGVNVKPVTLYNWVKEAAPSTAAPSRSPGSVEELRAQLAAVRKENRELARANEILQAAASFFGAELDRHSKR